MNGEINRQRLLGNTVPIPDEIKAQARVAIESEGRIKLAVVEWPDPVFHMRYVICSKDGDGPWETIARGWKGEYVKPQPKFLASAAPVSDWILEKIEEADAQSS